jgi:hypothetical protein
LKKRDLFELAPTNFNYDFTYVTLDGFTISKGDLIKIKGEYGIKFKFHALTTNKITGSQWIDCFEVSRGQVGALRSFGIERLKRVPTRGKRAKRVV